MEFTTAKKSIKKILTFKKRYLIHYFISFMMGRIFIMGTISPFALSYICSYMRTESKTPVKMIITVAMALAGILTTQYSYTTLRYLLAYVLFGLIYISVSTIWTKAINHLHSVASVSALAISGIIYYAQLGNIFNNMLMIAFECTICFIFPYIIKSSATIICDADVYEDIKPEDVTGICALTIITIGGFCGFNVGNIFVGKAICGALIMVIAYVGGCTFSVTCGIGVGILFSLYSFEYSEFTGIFGFCGFVTGIAARYKRPGIILAFILSTRLLSAYFGGWSDSIFSELETIISVCVFSLVPQSMLLRAKAYFSAGLTSNTEFKKYLDMVNSKIKITSKSFESLAELSQKVLSNIPENTNDLSTIYDIAAGKVCKSCGLKFICWNKESFDTRDILNKTVFILNETGHLDSENIPIEFKQKCIKYSIFASEMNRVYFKYKANHHWQERLEQSQKMLSVQLKGMSGIMDEFSKNITNSITFDKLEESKIMYNMEQEDIKCSDITVVKDHIDVTSVTVIVKNKKDDFTDLCKKIEEIISETLNKNMKVENYSCIKNKFTLKLKEAERFAIDCSYISIPKNGEEKCGDNVIHGKISGGKYTAILSDGMGCGKKAATQSITAIELMQQFLNAGFDKKTSVEMINSTLMLKNSETFATLDAVIIDMFTAKTEFVKAGANTTYIKTDNCIKKISSNTLPIGIINNTKAETKEYQAKNGDIIILISDGIHNATDSWFEEYILNMHEDNPKLIAKLLADEAQRRKKQDDDMTVAVLKIIKNEEGLYV